MIGPYELNLHVDTDSLAYAIRRSRLNRAEVARRSGVSLSFLSDLLGGLIAVPDGPTLPRIAKVLGVDVIDLLRGGY